MNFTLRNVVFDRKALISLIDFPDAHEHFDQFHKDNNLFSDSF